MDLYNLKFHFKKNHIVYKNFIKRPVTKRMSSQPRSLLVRDICTFCGATFSHLEELELGLSVKQHLDPVWSRPQCTSCRRTEKWKTAHPPSPMRRRTLASIYTVPSDQRPQRKISQPNYLSSLLQECENQKEDDQHREETMPMSEKSCPYIWRDNNLMSGFVM